MAMESERTLKDSGDDPPPPHHKVRISHWARDHWARDSVDLVYLIYEGYVRDVDAVKQCLARAGDSGCLSETTVFGLTPLMVACRNGYADIVNFLLEAGVDVNVTCDIGNSALHYACQGNEDVVSICRKKPAYPKEKLVEIIKIVKLLLNHGATLQMNDDGFSPACVAALSSFKDVVAFFTSSSVITMPLADKVKAYELLGVSQAVLDRHHAIDACESFHIAASLQSKEDSDVSPNHISSDFDAFLVEMMNKEDANENEKFEIQSKAYIIGIQYLPDKIIFDHDLLDAMGEFAETALFTGKAEQDGYEMLAYLIKREVIYQYPTGTVMEMIMVALEPLLRARESSIIKFIVKLLETYAEEFKADMDRIGEIFEISEIVENLGELMFLFSYFNSVAKYSESSFQSLVSIIKCIKEKIEPNLTVGDPVLSVCMDHWAEAYKCSYKSSYKCSSQSKRTRNRLKFTCTFSRFLHYWGFDPDTASFLLDTFLRYFYNWYNHDDMEWILSVARILIRYGGAVEDVSLKGINEGDPEVAELLDLLTPPTTPLSLEELATRTVLRNNIPFRGRLPVRLCDRIERELYLNPDASELDSSTDSDTD